MAWLMEGDPSIRWQTMKALLDSSEAEIAAERRLVATQGWGADLLSHQDDGGTWGGGLYGPKWISTTYTLLLLRRLGLPAGHEQAIAGCIRLLDDAQYIRGGVNYSPKQSDPETCINSMVLSILSALGHSDQRIHGVAESVLNDHMSDGGWNCQHVRGATHSSFHTTISALEGLHEYHLRWPDPAIEEPMADGMEFLNEHGMYRSHTTGKVINPVFGRLPFPPRWHFDILRGLDHFQMTGTSPDPRLSEVIQLIQDKRGSDGRWKLNAGYSGQTWFEMEKAGRPSRWNTLRALRVLRWWEGSGTRS